MSRRTGQNPAVRVGERTDGTKYFFFQYWIDTPGREERQRKTEVLGPVKTPKSKYGKEGTVECGLTWSEAERSKREFLANLNSQTYQLPSSKVFADAVRHYRQKFAPKKLRGSTFDIANGHLKNHLESDWNDVPVDHINIDAVNDWIWKKKEQGLSWVTIKNVVRTMQRVLSAASKDKKPPFSQKGLDIPEQDKLQMTIANRQKPILTWNQALKIVEQVHKLDCLGALRKGQYSALFLLASASGLRCSELLALRYNDIDFDASSVRVDEGFDQRTQTIGLCKNARAYRTVLLLDPEGKRALSSLRQFMKDDAKPEALVFHSKRNRPLQETCILIQGLHPCLDALGIRRAGLHAFRAGCNRRWELAGIVPAVIRQQMGHSDSKMTERYTGELSLDEVRVELENNGKRKSTLIAA